MNGCHTEDALGNATNNNVTSAMKPAALDATDKKAVIGLGAPS
jgi:hypothetical protein